MTASASPNKPSRLLAEALDLAGRGWRIIPLHDVAGGLCSCGAADCTSPGKHPRTDHGLKDGTTDAATIRRWWSRWPTANIGVCTGPKSGVVMVGPDGQAGIDALAKLESEHGELPRTPRTRSGSGGRHYYFRWPVEGSIGNRRNRRGLPIDVRGQGGYFVAPPSRNQSGPYVWEVHPNDCLLADAPEWLLSWCQANEAPRGGLRGQATKGASITDRAIKYLAKVPPAISGQGGHDQTLEAARIVAWGFDLGAEVAYQILASHYNPRCQPPWTEKELRHKCEEADTVPFGKSRGWLLTEKTVCVTAGCPKKPPPRPLPGCAPFPLVCLPPVLREYVDAAAAAIGCDVSLVALPALAVAAGCIGNRRAIQLRRGWREPAVLWAITIVRSGGAKSPGFAAAVDPLLEYQMDGWDAYQRAKQEAKANEEEEPKPPPCFTTSDATIEAVGELLRDNPRGLLLARDELDGWFQGFTRHQKNGATDRPHWLELYSARGFRLDRITRNRGPLAVRRACCSICGTIQPAVLARALDAEALGAGLGARFLLAMPPIRKRVWTEAEVAEELGERYARLLQNLLRLRPEEETKRKPQLLTLAPAAKSAWVEWFNSWGELQYNASDERSAVLAKLEGGAARLALLHHVVAHVAVDADDCRPVGELSIRSGITLAEWFSAEAERVYAVLRETEDQRQQRELIEWIKRHGDETTDQHLRDSWRGRYPRTEDAESALDELAEAEAGSWIWRPSGPHGGRPTRVFRLTALETSQNPGNFEVSSAVSERNGCREPGEEG
jgi:hypothetical protein